MKILYFAALKESLNMSYEEITLEGSADVARLKEVLAKKHGRQHFSDNILCAVNHSIANNSQQLNNQDEVAFYPPVTGG